MIFTTSKLEPGFLVFYGSRSIEVHASDMFRAKDQGIAYFKVPKTKQYLVSSHLCEEAPASQRLENLSIRKAAAYDYQ